MPESRSSIAVRAFAEFEYAAESWGRARRVIGKAEHLPGSDDGKANPRYVVTNLAGDARPLYEDVYCQRGEAENALGVDRDPAPFQLLLDHPVAVRGELFRDAHDRRTHAVIDRLDRVVVEAAATQLQEITEEIDSEARLVFRNESALGVEGQRSIAESFFAASSSTVNRPMRRSRSSVRWRCASSGVAEAKTW
jgi:Transposase DDE domain group 1